jgi:NAD(P)-dependent dehydrogenase (short-subunit alcohol dehydrogenase family)
MACFVTGGTGLIGRSLIERLLARGSSIYVLVRPESAEKFERLRTSWGAGAGRVVAVPGDLLDDGLVASGPEPIEHFFHLAALQDYASLDETALHQTNVEGTRRALALARSLGAETFHHLSTWGVSGAYDGVFREEMFDEGIESTLPYFRSKREAEAVVRSECRLEFRIYRPGIVVGRSDTGEVDSADGLYYLFKALQTVADGFPRWFPMPGGDGGHLNVVPVDYVAGALDTLAHQDTGAGRCHHLTNPADDRFGEVIETLAHAARAPSFSLRLDARMLELVPARVRQHVFRFFPSARMTAGSFMDMLGVPSQLMEMAEHPTRYDCSETTRALEEAGIRCPPLADYVHRLWAYWESHLDPDLCLDSSLEGAVSRKTVLVTGASSGIGKASSRKFAAAGAKVLLVARSAEKLAEIQSGIEAEGGEAQSYPTDLSDTEACQVLVQKVLADHGAVDILVNNAGHSISRLLTDSFERLHDYERTMALNYFGPVALCLGLLPAMRERGFGQIINVLSLGVQVVGPGFSAYCASKTALETFSNGVRLELADDGIHVTNIYMGLVHTPMSAPSKMFNELNGLSPEGAADLVCRAAIDRRISDSVEAVGPFTRLLWAVWPRGAATFLQATGRGMRAVPGELRPT